MTRTYLKIKYAFPGERKCRKARDLHDILDSISVLSLFLMVNPYQCQNQQPIFRDGSDFFFPSPALSYATLNQPCSHNHILHIFAKVLIHAL
jgi:hypothetical protein